MSSLFAEFEETALDEPEPITVTLAGKMRDGEPRAVLARELTPIEWLALKRSLPVPANGGPGQPDEEEALAAMRRVCAQAVVKVRALRSTGEVEWVPVKLLLDGEPNAERHEVPFAWFDRADNVVRVWNALIDAVNNPGPEVEGATFRPQ